MISKNGKSNYNYQPEGCVTVGPRERRRRGMMLRRPLRDGQSFVFTLTDKDSAKVRFGD